MRRLRPINRRTRQRALPTAFEPIAVPDDDAAETENTQDGSDLTLATDRIAAPAPASQDFAPYAAPAPDSWSAQEPAMPRRRRRLRLPRLVSTPGLPWTIDWRALLLATVLIVGGSLGTLQIQDRLSEDLPGDLRAWWPAAFAALSLLWMLSALIRRQTASFLGGAALGGVAFSLLLEVRDIASVQDTLLGIVLIALGLGIVIRGLLLRQHVPYRP